MAQHPHFLFWAWLPPGGLFSKTEMSEVLTEILRVDPAFDKDRFLQQCQSDIIPNVLEVGCHLPLGLWAMEGLGQQTQVQGHLSGVI